VTDLSGAGPDHVQDVAELRSHVMQSLEARADAIVRETIAVCLFAGMDRVGVAERGRLITLIFQGILDAVRDGTLDSRSSAVAELGRLMAESEVDARAAFSVVYLTERAALDEVSADEAFGSTSQPWPVVAQFVRRASFDVCAAISEYNTRELAPAAIVDPLTTLYATPVFVAALDREIQRSERFGHPFAVILLDVDHLTRINAAHGYGTGDRVLERIGIIVRNYFRTTDWVARAAGDTFAVLMPETQGVNAERLADRVRVMVNERLQLHDHRSDQPVRVTVSVGVLIAETVEPGMRAEELMLEARQAVDRAKEGGRNRIERVNAVLGRTAAPREGMSID
jgi:diguanylate cyclase (GGDEF)-like protein